MANFNYTSFTSAPSNSFGPQTLWFRDLLADSIVSGALVQGTTLGAFSSSPIVTGSGNNITSTWVDDSKSVKVIGNWFKIGVQQRIKITVINRNNQSAISRLIISLPSVFTNSGVLMDTVYHGGLGGSPVTFPPFSTPMPFFNPGNTNIWPGPCTFPLMDFYCASGTDHTSFGVTFLNPDLNPNQINYSLVVDPVGTYRGTNLSLDVTDGSASDTPNITPFILPGETKVYYVEYNEYLNKEAHWSDYRNRFLQPLMKSLGFPNQTIIHTKFPWSSAISSNQSTGLAQYVSGVISTYGITTHIQWPNADGNAFYYEPNPANTTNWPNAKTTSQLAGISGFGFLVVPHESERFTANIINQNGSTFSQNTLDLDRLGNFTRESNLKLALYMRASGCNFGYYDTGGGPVHIGGSHPRPKDWARTFIDFKNQGINLLGEGGGDINLWITGCVLRYLAGQTIIPDFSMIKAILPGTYIVAYDNSINQISGVDHWTRFMNNGMGAILIKDVVPNQLNVWQTAGSQFLTV